MKKNILSFLTLSLFLRRHKIMKMIILVLSLILITHITNSYFSFQEGLTTNTTSTNASETKQIILFGDSVLKNNNYVSSSMSVETIIKKIYSNTINHAEDNGTIENVYKQLAKVDKDKYNTNTTYIFISAGGNDLIKLKNADKVLPLYLKLITTITEAFPLANLYVLDMYYPTLALENVFAKSIITQWNALLKKNLTEKIKIVTLSNILTDPTDFIAQIEPSSIGGKKIAEAIIGQVRA
jgi:lysophospholipase L1-like esterase